MPLDPFESPAVCKKNALDLCDWIFNGENGLIQQWFDTSLAISLRKKYNEKSTEMDKCKLLLCIASMYTVVLTIEGKSFNIAKIHKKMLTEYSRYYLNLMNDIQNLQKQKFTKNTTTNANTYAIMKGENDQNNTTVGNNYIENERFINHNDVSNKRNNMIVSGKRENQEEKFNKLENVSNIFVNAMNYNIIDEKNDDTKSVVMVISGEMGNDTSFNGNSNQFENYQTLDDKRSYMKSDQNLLSGNMNTKSTFNQENSSKKSTKQVLVYDSLNNLRFHDENNKSQQYDEHFNSTESLKIYNLNMSNESIVSDKENKKIKPVSMTITGTYIQGKMENPINIIATSISDSYSNQNPTTPSPTYNIEQNFQIELNSSDNRENKAAVNTFILGGSGNSNGTPKNITETIIVNNLKPKLSKENISKNVNPITFHQDQLTLMNYESNKSKSVNVLVTGYIADEEAKDSTLTSNLTNTNDTDNVFTNQIPFDEILKFDRSNNETMLNSSRKYEYINTADNGQKRKEFLSTGSADTNDNENLYNQKIIISPENATEESRNNIYSKNYSRKTYLRANNFIISGRLDSGNKIDGNSDKAHQIYNLRTTNDNINNYTNDEIVSNDMNNTAKNTNVNYYLRSDGSKKIFTSPEYVQTKPYRLELLLHLKDIIQNSTTSDSNEKEKLLQMVDKLLVRLQWKAGINDQMCISVNDKINKKSTRNYIKVKPFNLKLVVN